MQSLVDFFQSFPPTVATFLIAMIPVGELRASLPIALLVYNMPWPLAMIVSIAGNMLPVYFLLLFFEAVARWLSERFSWAKYFFDWLFKRTRRRLSGQVKRYGYWALALFVAVPSPVTGAWTGTVAAFVFGLPKIKSFYAILLGVCIAAVVVTMAIMGGNAAVMRVLLVR